MLSIENQSVGQISQVAALKVAMTGQESPNIVPAIRLHEVIEIRINNIKTRQAATNDFERFDSISRCIATNILIT